MGDASGAVQFDLGLPEALGASDPAQNHQKDSDEPPKSNPSSSNGLDKESNEKKSSLKGTPSPASNPRLKAARSNFTVPQPFSLTTEKRATLTGSKPAGNGVPTPIHTQKVAAKKVESPAQAAKPNTSSPAGTTPRTKAEFVFRSGERAQKRMEFYASLTEKSKAREAEKSRIQANTQQQMAAEIKKLRKDQTFKASPMPKFYNEPPPVRIDVKKTPPTRPKSPKLGRRGSNTPDAAPKIIARRSSDEYKPPTDTKPSQTEPHEDHPKQPIRDAPETLEHEGSEHGSSRSRKSDNMVPKATLSEDEENGPLKSDSIAPRAALSEDEELSGSLKSDGIIPKAALSEEHSGSHKSDNSIPKAALSEDDEHSGSLKLDSLIPKAALSEDGEQSDFYNMITVSSSLLDDGEDEFGSEFDDEDDPQDDNVKVYISEELRQAAKDHSQDEDEDPTARVNEFKDP